MRSITVIIPTNRLDAWLNEAAASVLASVGVAVQLVIVLDGPVEGDMPAWSDDERVLVLRHTDNRGPSAAMMSALRAASSVLIARLDSDDVCHPERLAMQSAYLDAHPETVAVGARTARIGADGLAVGRVKLPFGNDIRRNLLLSNVLPHSTLMFRREVGEQAGGYNLALRQMEDYDFILRLAWSGPIAQLEETLVDYRVHSGQASRGAKPFGRHIRIVLRGRRKLGVVLKISAVIIELNNVIWVAAQYARYWGITRPAHEY